MNFHSLILLLNRRGNPAQCDLAKRTGPLPTLPTTMPPPATWPTTIIYPTTKSSSISAAAPTTAKPVAGKVGMLQHVWGTAVALVMAYWLGLWWNILSTNVYSCYYDNILGVLLSFYGIRKLGCRRRFSCDDSNRSVFYRSIFVYFLTCIGWKRNPNIYHHW